MGAFGKQYIKQNPGGDVADKDSAYILAFQTIMLNTDLHNASIAPKKKMNFGGLKRNLRGVNNKADFRPEFLYQSHVITEQII